MWSNLFHTTIYDPLYNGLVFLVGIVPGHDVGLAVIALTVIARFILFPLYVQSRKRDLVTDNYLFPIFHSRHGDKLKGWQAAGHAVGPMAINLSARQFRRADLDTHIRALVASIGVTVTV